VALVYEALVGDAAVLQVRAGSNGAREIVAEVGPVGVWHGRLANDGL
jgi:hypothetical protein